MTATVISIAATKRRVDLGWMCFMNRAFTGAVDKCQGPKIKTATVTSWAVSVKSMRFRTYRVLFPRRLRFVTQANAYVAGQEIISAPVKRQSLQTADHLVAGPKAGAVAN